MRSVLLLLGSLLGSLGEAATTRVLFVGNSFTFVNELPQQLAHVAASLGQDVFVNSSTVGGCTVYAQTADPSLGNDALTAELLADPLGWDYIVLQTYSSLPLVKAAREKMLAPAVDAFSARAAALRPKPARLVMYLTWGYHDGEHEECPTSSGPARCFPFGSLASLTSPPCADAKPPKHTSAYESANGNFSCMGYGLARGYLDVRASRVAAAADAADAPLVAPCGLAWQAVRGLTTIPPACKAAHDAEFAAAPPLPLPLVVEGAALGEGFLLNRYSPPGSKKIDKHPNVAGQYLNALTFFATLFPAVPLAAAAPPLNTGSKAEGDRPLTTAEMKALQAAAAGVVAQCGAACR